MSGHETGGHGVRSGVVLATIAALAGVIALVAALVHVLAMLWHTPAGGANAPMDVRIPGPVLESAPAHENARGATESESLLARYEWIDREKGIARIPIDSAIQILATQGRGQGAGANAPSQGESGRSAHMTPASATLRPTSAMSEQDEAAVGPVATPEVAQRPGTQLPLDVRLADENGREVSLGRYFGGGPVVMVFGYYRCPNLCSTLMESVLVSLSAMSDAPAAYEIVGIGIDPRENAADAAAKATVYRSTYASLPLHLLAGTGAASERLARAAGVRYAYDAQSGQYAHPLAVLVLAPDGRISRYFAGVKFDPETLRLGLIEAADGRIGTLTDRIFLRCAHYDPATGRYTLAAMTFVRGGSLVIALGLGLWMWRGRGRRSPSARASPPTEQKETNGFPP